MDLLSIGGDSVGGGSGGGIDVYENCLYHISYKNMNDKNAVEYLYI